MDKNILLLGLGIGAYFMLKKKDEPLGVKGCTNPNATNFNPSATTDDGSCVVAQGPVLPPPPIYPPMPPPQPGYPPVPNMPILGCTNPQATNYNQSATANDGSCQFPVATVSGCTNSTATNYNSLANLDDGSCVYTAMDCWQDCQPDGSTPAMQQSVTGSCPTTHPNITQPTGCPTTCSDANANNNGGALPCVYTEVTCYDNGCPTPGTVQSTNAVCPATHPHKTQQSCGTDCQDALANNVGQPLPCTYTEFDCYDNTCPTPLIQQSVNAVCPATHPNTTMPVCSTDIDCWDNTCPTPNMITDPSGVCPATHPNTTMPTCGPGISCWEDCLTGGVPANMITEYGAQCPATHPNLTEPNCVLGCSDQNAANYNPTSVGSQFACV